MSIAVNACETPIYIFDSQFRENDLYAAHPVNVDQNVKRLKEFHVDSARIFRITDSSYLQRELSLNQKSIFIVGGGYTYFLSKELEPVADAIRTAVLRGKLNVLGQCAGGNMLCEKISLTHSKTSTRNFQDLQPLRLLPVIADTAVYPLERSNTLGDLVNRRISILVNDCKETFASYWYRGSHYKVSEELAKKRDITLSTLACYTDVLGSTPIAAVRGNYASGSTVIACGAHSEIVNVEIPGQNDVVGRLSADEGRKKHLKTIYTALGVIPKMSSKL